MNRRSSTAWVHAPAAIVFFGGALSFCLMGGVLGLVLLIIWGAAGGYACRLYAKHDRRAHPRHRGG